MMVLSMVLTACGEAATSSQPGATTSAGATATADATTEASSAPSEEPTPEIETIRLGYLLFPAIDGHVRVGNTQGFWAKRGIEFETTEFDAGGPVTQALVGGSLDMGIIGGATPIFNCQGIVQTFVFNAIEPYAGAIWAGPDVATVADLQGKTVGTIFGTTAHIMLIVALDAAGLTQDDVEVVNLEPAAVVSAFIAGQVDAISPFAEAGEDIAAGRPDAHQIAESVDYFPRATVMGGWIVSPEFAEENHDLLVRVVLGWLDANDYIINHPTEAADDQFEQAYEALGITRERFDRDYVGIVQYQPNAEWLDLIENGEVEEIQTNLTEDFRSVGRIETCVPTSEWLQTYYDIYQEAYALWEEEQE